MAKLKNMLDDYINHIRNNKNSLIARIYGIFTIKSRIFSDVNIMVMQNTAMLRDRRCKKYSFDLKGSLIGRKTPYLFGQSKNNVLKDVNFREMNTIKKLVNISRQNQ